MAFLKNYDGVLLMLGAGGVTILIKCIVACIYTRLLHQVQQISTTKNKWMRNMICKYETTYKMNLKINDAKSLVFMQMNSVKYAGISLYNLKNMGIYGFAVTCIIYAVYMICGFYEKYNREWYIKMSVVMLTVTFAIWLSELFLQLNQKDRLLAAELYDYLENTLQPRLNKSALQNSHEVQERVVGDNEKEEIQAESTAISENEKTKNDINNVTKNTNEGKEDVYGKEELELFKEFMEGIYGEEI